MRTRSTCSPSFHRSSVRNCLGPVEACANSRGWPVNQQGIQPATCAQKRARPSAGLGERVQLSAGAGELLGRRGEVCRREEPSSYEAGLRAHGSNHRFHRLLGHAVARALTTAPRLTGLGPAAPEILIIQGWRRKRRPGRCCTKARNRPCSSDGVGGLPKMGSDFQALSQSHAPSRVALHVLSRRPIDGPEH